MKKIAKYGILFIAFILVVLVIKGVIGMSINSTYSKYNDTGIYRHYLTTKNIYFESTSLNEDYVVVNNYNYENIGFDIYNGNGSLISNAGFNYEISCVTDNSDYDCILDNDDDIVSGTFESSMACYNNGTVVDLSNSECTANNYQWDYSINSSSHTIKLINNGNNTIDTVTATVTFSTTSGYSYELEGEFVFNITNSFTNNNISYDVYDDIGSMCLVKVRNTYSSNKTVNITTNNSNYYFDNTNFNSLNVVVNSSSDNITDIDLPVSANSTVYLNMYSVNGTCSSDGITVESTYVPELVITYSSSFICNGTTKSSGTCEIEDGDWYVKFLESGTLTVTEINSNQVDVFLVGGGGAGGGSWQNASIGYYEGGYGGNGGTVNQDTVTLSAGTSYTIVIGDGGTSCGSGDTTSAFSLSASGGVGGTWCGGSSNCSSHTNNGNGIGSSGTIDGTYAFSSTFDGIKYGAGGGYGRNQIRSAISGGTTGGGNGNGGSATANTGSGGGGGTGYNGGGVKCNGGAGGSGIVIIKNHS